MVGQSISHYKIVSELGRGGMGIVYEAEDTRLHRTVAIKVLPSSALSNEDDRARFYREARAAASLTHPHIAVVHEIDEAVPEGSKDYDLRPFIAMEFIEGETLDAKIKKGPLRLDEAVRIASEIASGLEAAHEKNIVHRDIKSGNVMLTAKGEAKILDFGLAQTAQSTKLTRMGSTVGTIGFMSPEQARGEEVDRRTDIWSLGVVLYEMISGKHPFPGEYEQAVVYEILNQDPAPLTSLRTGVPMEVELVVEKCLQKNPKYRYQHADDLIADLSRIDAGVFSSSSTRISTMKRGETRASGARDPRKLIGRLLAAALLLVAVSAAASWFFFKSVQPTPPDRLAASIALRDSDGRNLRFVTFSSSRSLAISPDGSRIVFSAESEGMPPRLYVQQYPSFHATMIPGTENGNNPAFSPDGTQVAYYDDRFLMIVNLDGGLPTKVTGYDSFFSVTAGVTWISEDVLVYGPSPGAGLYRISTDGTSREPLTRPDTTTGELQHKFPHALPDGSGFVFTVRKDDLVDSDEAELWLYDFASDGKTRLVLGGTDGRVLDEGFLLFSRDDGLVAAEFDGRNPETVGEHRPVGRGVRYKVTGEGEFAVSASGTLIFVPANPVPFAPLQIRTRDRVVHEFDTAESMLIRPRFHPLGREVIVETLASINQLFRTGSDRTDLQPFITRANSLSPEWSPDGEWVAFISDRDGTYSVYRKSIQTGLVERLTSEINVEHLGNWTQDGKSLFLGVRTSESSEDIWILSQDSVWSATPLIATERREYFPQISPDGTLLLHVEISADSRRELFVQRFPALTDKRRIATGLSGIVPRWDDSSRRVYFVNVESALLSANVSTTDGLRASPPQVIFRRIGGFGFFDVSGDGQDFLVLADSSLYDLPVLDEFRVITGWTTRLQEIMDSN